MAILSSDVVAGTDATAAQYNNLRTDLLTGDVTLAGVKTFNSAPILSAGIADISVTNSILLAATKKLYLDGGGDTYIVESAANYMDFVVGGTTFAQIRLDSNKYHILEDMALAATKKLYLDGGGNTYIVESGADNFRIVVGGVEIVNINATTMQLLGDLTVAATKKIYLDGGTHTYITESGADVMDLYCGGTKSLSLGVASATFIGNIHALDVNPLAPGASDLGNVTNYYNDVNYKNLQDRGCLGCFDNGVELSDGSIVTDLEAIVQIKKHPTKMTSYNVPMLDYKSFPKVSYNPAIKEKDGTPIGRDSNGEPLKGADAVEMTSMFSIFIGAFKEIQTRLTKGGL